MIKLHRINKNGRGSFYSVQDACDDRHAAPVRFADHLVLIRLFFLFII
jgi:hypothetical protein